MEKLTPQQLNYEAFKCELRVMPFSEITDYQPLLEKIDTLDAHTKNQVALALYRDKKQKKETRVNQALSIWNKVHDAEAMSLISTTYFQHNDKERGVSTLREAIALGSVTAQLRAGYCTLMGIGVRPDLDKASNIFKRLAKEKVPEAVYFTGALYMMGSDTTPKDPERAKKLLMWSVEHGCKFAEFEGYEVYEAVDGMDAVQKCEEMNYDCIIMDIMMPKKDGYQAVREIRKARDLKTSPQQSAKIGKLRESVIVIDY